MSWKVPILSRTVGAWSASDFPPASGDGGGSGVGAGSGDGVGAGGVLGAGLGYDAPDGSAGCG
jgi:hypothetical protein